MKTEAAIKEVSVVVYMQKERISGNKLLMWRHLKRIDIYM